MEKKTTKAKGKIAKVRRTSGERAKLCLPVCRIASLVRQHVPAKMHVSHEFMVAATAAIEYMDRELIELMAEQKGKSAILSNKKLVAAIAADDELREIFRGFHLAKPKSSASKAPITGAAAASKTAKTKK